MKKYFSVKLSNGNTFDVEEGQSILDGAIQNGFQLPYSCKTGRCSTCKSKITGRSKALLDELGISKEDISNGAGLVCVRTPETDLELDISDLGDLNLPKPQTIPVKVSSKVKISENVMILKLRLPPNKVFQFIAGQYVNLIGPNNIRRSYSLANTVVESELELQISRVQNGLMSDFIFNHVKKGDLLRVNGPHGTFVLRDLSNKHLVFLATGTGIAPVQSMLGSLPKIDQASLPSSTTIYWGARIFEDLYVDIKTHDFLQYYPVLSRAGQKWSGRRGYVHQNMLDDFDNLSDVIVYACGSNKMISDAKNRLIANGHPSNQFFSDAFVASS